MTQFPSLENGGDGNDLDKEVVKKDCSSPVPFGTHKTSGILDFFCKCKYPIGLEAKNISRVVCTVLSLHLCNSHHSCSVRLQISALSNSIFNN